MLPFLLLAAVSQTPTAQSQPTQAPPPRVQDPSVPPAVTLPKIENPQVPTAPLTADEAARIALKLQPSLGQALGAIKVAHGNTLVDRAQLNPQVMLGAGYDRSQSLSGATSSIDAPYLAPIPGISPVYAYNAAAEVKQLLFDFNHTREIVRQDQAIERAQEANLTAQQLQLVYAVKQAFYNYANAVRLVKVNEENVQNRQRQLDLANARFQNGIGEPIDVVNAETSKSQGIVALNVARNAESQAAIALLNFMGVNPLTPISVAPESSEKEVAASDPSGLIDQALKSRPEVRAARSFVQAYGHSVSAAKTSNLPSIYLGAVGGVAGPHIPLANNVGAVGIGFEFPIIDGGQRAGEIDIAKGQLLTAQSNLSTTELTVENDVANAYMAVKTAEQSLTIANNEVANASEGVRIAEGRYSASLGQFQDILTAQGLLVSALTDQTQAQNSVDQARAQLRHAIGVMFSDQ